MRGYCLRCRQMVTTVTERRVVLKSDRLAMQGDCPQCRKTVSKIIGKRGA